MNDLNLSVYFKKEKIGEGTFGKVFKIIEKSTGKIYAAKVSKIKLSKKNKSNFTNIEREINIMAQLNHPSILRFIGYSRRNFYNKLKPVIITEYASNKSLRDIIMHDKQSESSRLLSDTNKLINIFGIASAMSFLHANNIIHRDLKPENILENDYLFPQIADFGLSKKFHQNSESMSLNQSNPGIIGTSIYISPEGLQKCEYTKAGDVYSFSIIVYEIMTLQAPFKFYNICNHIYQVSTLGVRPDFNVPIADCYKELIIKCWSQEPNERPTFDDIVNDLKSNEDFIIDGVNKEDYLHYIELIENSNCSFDPSKKFPKFTVLKTHHRKNSNQTEEFKNYEESCQKNIDHSLKKRKTTKITLLDSVKESSLGFKSDDLHSSDIIKLNEVQLRQRSEFEIGPKIIGKGSSGCVRIAIDKINGQKVAFKEMYPCIEMNEQVQFYKEIEFLAKINHYSIQKLYGYINEDINDLRPSVILTLFEENDNLEKFIQKNQSNLNFTQKYIIMFGIAAGLNYLHERNIIHGKINPKSILITEQMEPKITNFDQSKIAQNNEIHQKLWFGEIIYTAPELLEMEKDDNISIHKAKLFDVYSFSLIVYYIFVGKKPWSDVKQTMFLLSKIISGERPNLPSNLPKFLSLLIQACWEQKSSERPSFSLILDIIGDDTFLFKLENKIDINRIKEYQAKVLPERLLKSDTNQMGVFINNVVFPKIPVKKFFSSSKFEFISGEIKNKNQYLSYREAKLKNKLNDCFYHIIKVKSKYLNNTDVLELYSSQIQVLLAVNHPVINKLYGCLNIQSKAIKTKCEYNSLYKFFPKNKKLPEIIVSSTKYGNLLNRIRDLSITDKLIILYGIASGMAYLHDKEIVHLNLNPENILLTIDHEPIIKIGLTCKAKLKKLDLFSILSEFSFHYVAPELLNEYLNNNENLKICDVYSYAMICYFVLTGVSPWINIKDDYPLVLMKAMNGERPQTKGIIPFPFTDLIEDCWNPDLSKRPSFNDILDRMGSPVFVKSINNIEFNRFLIYQSIVEKDYIPIQPFKIRSQNDFENIRVISRTQSAVIKLAKDKLNNSFITYKEIIIPKCKFIERAKLFAQINFPSIIKPIDLIKPNNEKVYAIILLPYAKNGNLDLLLKKYSLQYTQKCIILYGIAVGMYKLHEQGMAHKNLTPQNILINNFEPWISGFTAPEALMDCDFRYIAPEILFLNPKEPINIDEQLCDVYSFGMIAYYLFTNILPWGNLGNNELYRKINNNEKPIFMEDIEQQVIDLISKCWENKPELRPSFKEICEIISDSNFYLNSNEKFDKKKFYKYQLKLGELNFIKFSDDEIKSFNNSFSNKSSRDAVYLSFDKANQLNNYFDNLHYFQNVLNDRNPNDHSFLISANKTEDLFEIDQFNTSQFSDFVQNFDEISIEINFPSNSFSSLIEYFSKIVDKYKKKINIIIVISNVSHLIGIPMMKYPSFSVKIQQSVTSIGPNAFKNCSSLLQIEIPSSVIKIGKSAFEGCTSLAHIEIPSSVIMIGEKAFKKCSSLTKISIHSSLKKSFNAKDLMIDKNTEINIYN